MNLNNPLDKYIPDPPGPDDDRFGNSFKNWREWNAAFNFLTNLQCGAVESKIFSLKADPPDVIFESARFEVKEILDEGRRRHDELKAKRAHKILHEVKNRDFSYILKDLTPQEIGDLIQKFMQNKIKDGKYNEEQRSSMDLLFYVNKIKHCFENGIVNSPVNFKLFGWRSVSAVVASNTSIVFYANLDAPQFLIENIGVVRHR